MSYIWLNGYSTGLNAKLSSTDGLLPIDDAKTLAAKLGEGHSYLLINDGTGTEIVKAISFGNQVKIERAQDGTEAKSFPAGTCVKWEATKQGLADTICEDGFPCLKTSEDCGCCE